MDLRDGYRLCRAAVMKFANIPGDGTLWGIIEVEDGYIVSMHPFSSPSAT